MIRTTVAAFALPALCSGCFAASISTHVSEPIRAPQPTDVAVLAVMPVVAEAGSEWLRPQTMDALIHGLSRRFPGVRLLDPTTVATRLAAESAADDYASLLADFDRAGVVDPERVSAVLDVLGATHFVHVRAMYAAQGLERTSTNFDGTPLFYSTKHQSLSVVARLWRSSSSGPAWEAVVRTESERGPFTRHRDAAELVESLVASVVERIPLAGAATAVGIPLPN